MTARPLRLALLLLAGFNGLTCVAAGTWLVATGGPGLPQDWLDALPSQTWLVPGLLLGLVVGGTQVVALGLHLRRAPSALAASALSGLVMVVWTYVEVAVLPEYSVLHTLYLGTGLAQVVLVLLALDVLRRGEEVRVTA